MPLKQVTLDDKYVLESGRVYLTGTQALVRLPMLQRQLRETQRSYGEMMSAMDRVASSMDPVLAAFRDQVLVLKHNLNAVAIASLEGESAILEIPESS